MLLKVRGKSLDLFALAVYANLSRLKRGSMDSIKRVSSKKAQHHPSSREHKTLQKSTTLNRKFVKRPVASAQISKRQQEDREALLRRKALAEQMDRENRILIAKKSKGGVRLEPAAKAAVPAKATTQKKIVDERLVAKMAVSPAVATTRARVAAQKAEAPRQLTAQELKDRAIKQALQRVATMNSDGASTDEQMTDAMTKKRGIWRKRKLFVAIAMSAVSIALLGYLVHLNLPDLSVRVAAMQSGIDSLYPSYVPKGYRMNGLVSENSGKVTIEFSHKEGKSFTLVQEKSSWDSAALLSQFVIQKWGEDYLVIKEQGLTIYSVGSDAAWVNGGVFYHIEDPTDSLTKQQLHDIAISL
jgi:G3E family GTPase